MTSGHSRRGFTVVELLVASGIVALLGALLLPAMASAREAGKGTVCESRLRQLAMATLLYAMDWDHRLPSHFRVERGHVGVHIFTLLEPYRGSFAIFVCPTGPVNAWGYGYNALSLNYRPVDSVGDPSGTIMWCDNTSRKTDNARVTHCWPPGYPGADNGPDPRHNGMANFAFVDGHVKHMPPWHTVSPVNLWDLY